MISDLNEALRALENTVAFSANERFELLEKRDKILRQGEYFKHSTASIRVFQLNFFHDTIEYQYFFKFK